MNAIRRWLDSLKRPRGDAEAERRSGDDRRSGGARRSGFGEPPLDDERRTGADRRSGDDRRDG
jgi:hypothetical protein